MNKNQKNKKSDDVCVILEKKDNKTLKRRKAIFAAYVKKSNNK
jgi:hypothetical protein